jgi:hypothetical protein
LSVHVVDKTLLSQPKLIGSDEASDALAGSPLRPFLSKDVLFPIPHIQYILMKIGFRWCLRAPRTVLYPRPVIPNAFILVGVVRGSEAWYVLFSIERIGNTLKNVVVS